MKGSFAAKKDDRTKTEGAVWRSNTFVKYVKRIGFDTKYSIVKVLKRLA